jgi:hypothetical protein
MHSSSMKSSWAISRRHVSVCNQRFEDYLSHHQGSGTYQISGDDDDNDDQDGPRNVGFIQTPDAADSQRKLHLI